jgi:ankyrin repeat protein
LDPFTPTQWAAVAARDGNISFLELAVSQGANLNAACVDPFKSRAMTSPLHAAASAGRIDMVELLVLRGADPALQIPGVGQEPSFSVAGEAYGVVADALVRLSGASAKDVEVAQKMGNLPLADAAGMRDIERMLDAGASPSAKTASGHTVFELLVGRACADQKDALKFGPDYLARWQEAESLAESAARKHMGAMGSKAVAAALHRACKSGKVALGLSAAEVAAKTCGVSAVGPTGALDALGWAKVDGKIAGNRVGVAKLAGILIDAGAAPRPFFEGAYVRKNFDLLNRVIASHPSAALADPLLSRVSAGMFGQYDDVPANAKLANRLLDLPGTRVLVGGPADVRYPAPLHSALDGALSFEAREIKDLRGRMVERALLEIDEVRATTQSAGQTCLFADGSTLAHLAAVTRDTRVVDSLISAITAAGPEQAAIALAARADVDARFGRGMNNNLKNATPFEAALSCQNWFAIAPLAAASGQANARVGKNQDPLPHLAVFAAAHDPAHIDAVDLLLAAGADPRAVNTAGETAREVAARRATESGKPDMSAVMARLEGAEINAELGARPTRQKARAMSL